MKRLLYALHDQLNFWMFTWSRRYGTPKRPRWLAALWHHLLVEHNVRTFVPKLVAAPTTDGPSRIPRPPTSSPGSILRWPQCPHRLSPQTVSALAWYASPPLSGNTA